LIVNKLFKEQYTLENIDELIADYTQYLLLIINNKNRFLQNYGDKALGYDKLNILCNYISQNRKEIVYYLSNLVK
jgi:hypothetical protein